MSHSMKRSITWNILLRKDMLFVLRVSKARKGTIKQVDKTGLSTVSIEVIFCKFYGRYYDLVSKCNLATLHWVAYCLMFFILIIRPYKIPNCPFLSRLRQRAYGSCDRSAEDAHSSMASDPTINLLRCLQSNH